MDSKRVLIPPIIWKIGDFHFLIKDFCERMVYIDFRLNPVIGKTTTEATAAEDVSYSPDWLTGPWLDGKTY